MVLPLVSISLKVLPFSKGCWTYWTFVSYSIPFSFFDITVQNSKEISVKLFWSIHTRFTYLPPFVHFWVFISYLCNFATGNLFNRTELPTILLKDNLFGFSFCNQLVLTDFLSPSLSKVKFLFFFTELLILFWEYQSRDCIFNTTITTLWLTFLYAKSHFIHIFMLQTVEHAFWFFVWW